MLAKQIEYTLRIRSFISSVYNKISSRTVGTFQMNGIYFSFLLLLQSVNVLAMCFWYTLSVLNAKTIEFVL